MRSSKAPTWLAMVSFSFCVSEDTRPYKPTRNKGAVAVILVMLLWQRAAIVLGACFLANSWRWPAARYAEAAGQPTHTLGPGDRFPCVTAPRLVQAEAGGVDVRESVAWLTPPA